MEVDFGKDYFEIRLESIGGLGANLSGKLLGELGALYMGLNASSFASYGSEKRGSPVKSFIRYAKPDKEIRINCPVILPDMVVVFHERLAGKPLVMAGVSEKTKIVVNSGESAEFIRDRFKICAGELFVVDALKIAMENKTRVNMVLLGAMAKASGFIPLECVEKVVSDTLGKKYPKNLEGNLKGIRAGFECAEKVTIPNDGKYQFEKYEEIKRVWGFDNAPIGGVNPIFGSSVSNDSSASREGYIPIFDKEKCINCGMCDIYCPDMVYQFAEGEYKGKKTMVNLGPDYRHCKGCMRCVEVCPTSAITDGLEREHDITKTNVDNVDLLNDNINFDDVGANSWVESTSYTTNEIPVDLGKK